MPSKSRWKLNPRKWFGAVANAAHKRNKDNKSHINNFIIPIPSTSTSTVPHLLSTRSKIKVAPTPPINDNNNSTKALPSVGQLQLAIFNKRREKSSAVLPSTTLFSRKNIFIPTRFETPIRKRAQINETLSIDTVRCNTQTVTHDTSNVLLLPTSSSQRGYIFLQQNSAEKQSDINVSTVSGQCLIDYPHNVLNNCTKRCSSSMRTRSTSSIDDNDDHDESSSSGIFSEERTDSNDRHRIESTEVLSIESLVDSHTSLDNCRPRSSKHHHRSSIPTFETMDNKSEDRQCQSPTLHFQRAHSAEDILQTNKTNRPVITKSRQSAAAIVKKIEKRIPKNRTLITTLEKASFVRIANDTYRLTTGKDDHLYRRQRPNSIVRYSTYDESLPPANDEESYAQLPRTSSTEQLDNNLRAVVNNCLRPVVASINQPTCRSIKSPHHSNHSHTQMIENITDKLLSSMDCSIYAQYQRCY